MTFSASGAAAEGVGRLLRRVRFVIEKEGFRVHPEKTRVFRKGPTAGGHRAWSSTAG